MVVANVRAMVPVVLNHGYPAEDVENVVEGTIAEVSLARERKSRRGARGQPDGQVSS